MKGIELTKQSFQEQVVNASRQKPVLVEFGGEWCPDCQVLDGNDGFQDALRAIAKAGVEFVRFEVPREAAAQEYWLHNPKKAREARKKGRDINTQEPYYDAVPVLIRRSINVRSYPTFLLVNNGKTERFYSNNPRTRRWRRRDRVTDSDLIRLEGQGEHRTRQIRPEGVQALVDSVRWHIANRPHR